MRSIAIALGAAWLTAASMTAQMSKTPAKAPPKKSAEEIRTALEAHLDDFNYLLGQWSFTAVNKEYGKFNGFWSAVKLPGGQLLDEYRVVDDKGATVYSTNTLRAYNAVLDQWELVGMDTGNGLNDVGSGRRTGGEVRIEQTFGVMYAEPHTMRIRYFDIKEDRFSWSADLSKDGGKTWIERFQTIEARRRAPARSVELFPPPNAR